MSKFSTALSVTDSLGLLLADTYALALKTQNYHWNVTGPLFYSLHKLFESQYQELHEVVDDVAERIRALGKYSPGSFSAFLKMTTIPEAKKKPSAEEMLQDLIKSHQLIIASVKNAVAVCQSHNDEPTADMLIGRIFYHQKQVWILKSSTKNP